MNNPNTLNEICIYENEYIKSPIDNNAIDAVIYYVDSSDYNWRTQYNKNIHEYDAIKGSIKNNDGNSIKKNRISDYGTLKYVLRSIDKYLKFIRKVHLVVQSDTQVPKWIDRNNVSIIYHEDFIPTEFLPTYNSTTLDMFIHRIPDLSERFLLFNDDIIVMRELTESDFYNGFEPKDIFYEYDINYDPTYGDFYKQWRINAEKIICKEFNRELTKFHEPPHGVGPMVKKDVEYLFNKYESDIKSSITKFRESINIEQYLWRLYSWEKNNRSNFGLGCQIIKTNSQALNQEIVGCTSSVICINDIGRENDYISLKKQINISLQYHFPEISKYEKTPRIVCGVISKDETPYLVEWIEHYKNIGIDKIIFYDNNDVGNDEQFNVLKPYIENGFVIYHDMKGVNDFQQHRSYQHCYDTYSKDFDWFTFLDVDEFLILTKHDNIKDFITSDYAFYDSEIIHLSWLNYGDNNNIEYVNKPVRERFNKPSVLSNKLYDDLLCAGFRENEYVKSIIKSNLSFVRYYQIKNNLIHECAGAVHTPGIRKTSKVVNAGGYKVPNTIRHYSDYNVAYLEHYRTKSVNEYLYKVRRGDVIFGDMHDYKNTFYDKLMKRFFRTNEITDEKRDIFRKVLPYSFMDSEWNEIIDAGKLIKQTDIDYIFPYVNSNDPEWVNSYKSSIKADIISNDILNGIQRYDPKDLLKYKFRSIEKYLPWIRNVYMIVSSPSQVPSWVDTSKVKIVYHKDFIPEEFLPTFSSLTIEMFLGNIKDLGENFIYGNDDTFFINELTPYHFFYKDKIVQNLDNRYIPNNPSRVLYYDIYKRSSELIINRKCDDLYIFDHCSKAFRKQYFVDIINNYKNIIYPSITPQRDVKNYSMMQMATLYDMKNSIPRKYKHTPFFLNNNVNYLYDKFIEINSSKYYEISIDNCAGKDSEEEYTIIRKWFEKLFPNQSIYELNN